MACGLGEDTAEDCAIKHWCPKLGARREANRQWRADCPVPGCGARRALEFDAPGRHVRWKSFCGVHDNEAVRPYLVKLVGACMPGGSRRAPIRHDDLKALALSGLPPQALKTQMLIYAGMTIAEAFDKLGVDRSMRYKVRGLLSAFHHKAAGRGR
jgi:hypothetical protein